MRLEIDRWMLADNHPTHPYKVIVDARSVGCGHRQSPAWANHAFRKLDELYLQGRHQIVEIRRRYSRKMFSIHNLFILSRPWRSGHLVVAVVVGYGARSEPSKRFTGRLVVIDNINKGRQGSSQLFSANLYGLH